MSCDGAKRMLNNDIIVKLENGTRQFKSVTASISQSLGEECKLSRVQTVENAWEAFVYEKMEKRRNIGAFTLYMGPYTN